MRLDTPLKTEIYQTLPFIARKELNELKEYMNTAFEANTHLIYNDPTDSVLYQFRDISNQFAFNVQFAQFDEGKRVNIYRVYCNPANRTKIKGQSYSNTFLETKETFGRWIDLIRAMHQVTEEYYDPLKKFYDEQFADFFTNDDEDAAVRPFELEKQEVLYYFLSYAEKTINNSTEISNKDKSGLLQEASELKEVIPTLTKKRFVSALSKLAQKTKMVSNKLFHEIFDVLKKEAIKKLLYEGADQIPNLMHQIHHWIS